MSKGNSVARKPRADWKAERDRIDLAAVVTSYLGPPPGRRGEKGSRSWWICPFHDDHNPSLLVDPARGSWRCWGCGEHGDAAAFVMKLEGKTFPEAVDILTGRLTPSGKLPARPASKPKPEPLAEPSGLPEAEAVALVETAAARLWTPEGAEALPYLTGPRCLNLGTIRSARLGWTPGTLLPTADGRYFQALGWVIPWFDREGRLALVKIRQPEPRKPKYAEAFRHPGRLICYPSPATVRPGRPLVITEGEFDCLALGEALGELCAVVTLGSASARPDFRVKSVMLAAWPWFIATDGDDAGDKAAERWPAQARRVRPPEPFNDWTEAAAGRPDLGKVGGVDLARWWRDILAGNPSPPLFTPDELMCWRWGPSIDDPEPGIDIQPPKPSDRPR